MQRGGRTFSQSNIICRSFVIFLQRTRVTVQQSLIRDKIVRIIFCWVCYGGIPVLPDVGPVVVQPHVAHQQDLAVLQIAGEVAVLHLKTKTVWNRYPWQ